MNDKAIAAAVEAWFADPTMRKSDLMQDRMRAAIAAYQAEVGEGWQPIESAPKDGTSILIFCGFSIVGSWVTDGARVKNGWSDDKQGINPIFMATHWQPLPEPPKASK